MSTPAKRRKKNDFQSSPQTVRSLDFFFGKQRKEQDLKAQKVNASKHHKGRDEVEPVADLLQNAASEALTDEELARQLQDEWNEEDRKPVNQADASGSFAVQGETADTLGDSNSRGEHRQLDSSVPATTTQKAAPLGSLGDKTTLSLQSATSTEDSVSTTIPFDESPLTFDPSQYLPSLKKHWAAEGGDAPYGLLTRCFILVNSTQSRIKIVDTLVNLLRTIIEGDPDSLLPTVRYSLRFNRIYLLRSPRSGWLQIPFLRLIFR